MFSILFSLEFVLGGPKVWVWILLLHCVIFYFFLNFYFITCVYAYKLLILGIFINHIENTVKVEHSSETIFRSSLLLTLVPVSKSYILNLLRTIILYPFGSAPGPMTLEYADDYDPRVTQLSYLREQQPIYKILYIACIKSWQN